MEVPGCVQDVRTIGGRDPRTRRERAAAAAVIHDVRHDIGQPGAWCQGTMENLWDAHCILGQFDEEREKRRHDQETISSAEGYVQEHIRGGQGIVQFNDAWFTSQRQVVDALWEVEQELDPAHRDCLGRSREHYALAAIDADPPRWAQVRLAQAEPSRWAMPCERYPGELERYRVERQEWTDGGLEAAWSGGEHTPHGVWQGQQPATPSFRKVAEPPARSRGEALARGMRENPALVAGGGVVVVGAWLMAPLLLVLTVLGLVGGVVAWKTVPVVLEVARLRRERAQARAELQVDDAWGGPGDVDDDAGDDPGEPATDPWEPPAPGDARDVEAPPSETRPRVESPVVIPTLEPRWDDPEPEPGWLPVEEEPEPLVVRSYREDPAWTPDPELAPVELPQHAGLARQSNGDLALALPPGGQGSWMDRRTREQWLGTPAYSHQVRVVDGVVRRG